MHFIYLITNIINNNISNIFINSNNQFLLGYNNTIELFDSKQFNHIQYNYKKPKRKSAQKIFLL